MVKNVCGPKTWIGEYVLATYGTDKILQAIAPAQESICKLSTRRQFITFF